jgi:transposase
MRQRTAMIRPASDSIEVYLCVEPVDFRNQINGLATLVQDTLAMSPFSAKVFAFTNPKKSGQRRPSRLSGDKWVRDAFAPPMQVGSRARRYRPRTST